ncbi:purine nucleoside permease [Rhodotorula toruloides]|uniref:Purine nucleoside permease n=1 Tax=Rhodotorula toruloides TaxID=5286 RepID=A0A511KRW3_RHOTO|nr:purine nucleoside permease [Rhodotorula toruloides]
MIGVIKAAAVLALAGSSLAAPASVARSFIPPAGSALTSRQVVISPKVMIISMFSPEREVWLQPMELEVDYPLTGASPLFPNVSCRRDRTVCIVTTGEAEINAASTVMALTLSTQFDLTSTYFLIAGIAGVNPYMGTLGSAGFARFSVQSGLAYELDARQMPSNWSTGYWALGTKAPGQLPNPSDLYGTEVFELNTNLLSRVLNITSGVKLNDSTTAQEYRKRFNYAPANEPPKIYQGDALCSDAYFAGTLLAETWGNYTKLMTKGEGNYSTTAQEDNATLEVMVRAHKAGLVDYSRIVLLRTASDFDRAPNATADAYTAFEAQQGGFEPAIQNLVIAGKPFVDDVVKNWDQVYAAGIAPPAAGNGSFYGDVFGTIRDGAAQARRARRSVSPKVPYYSA